MKKNLILDNIRELNGVSSIELIYAKLLVCTTVPLTYSKGYILLLRSIYVKYIVISFLLGPSIMFYYDM